MPSINSPFVREKFKLIDDTVQKISEFTNNNPDPLLNSYLAGYLAVLISGTYEECLENLFCERANRTGDEKIVAFVQNALKFHLKSPKYEKIKQTLLHYNFGLTLFERKINDRVISAYNSLMTNKENLAHGQMFTSTLDDIVNFHKTAIPLFEVLEKTLLL